MGGWSHVHIIATLGSNLQVCKISSRAEIPKLDQVWQLSTCLRKTNMRHVGYYQLDLFLLWIFSTKQNYDLKIQFTLCPPVLYYHLHNLCVSFCVSLPLSIFQNLIEHIRLRVPTLLSHDTANKLYFKELYLEFCILYIFGLYFWAVSKTRLDKVVSYNC